MTRGNPNAISNSYGRISYAGGKGQENQDLISSLKRLVPVLLHPNSYTHLHRSLHLMSISPLKFLAIEDTIAKNLHEISQGPKLHLSPITLKKDYIFCL